MTRLIDADALMNAMMQDGIWGHGKRVYDFINNAPTVESEAFGYVREDNVLMGKVIKGQWLNKDKVEEDDVPVYLAPQQPQTVEDEPRKAVLTTDKTPIIAARLPNGVCVTNVYEAYDAGMKEALEKAASISKMLKDIYLNKDFKASEEALLVSACDDYEQAIRVLIEKE